MTVESTTPINTAHTLTPVAFANVLNAAERHRITTEDSATFKTDIALQIWRNPGKPTLLLVHGYPDASDIWLPLVSQLQAEYQIITYDVRGAGHSSRPYSIDAYALTQLMHDMHAVIDAVNPDTPVHVIGHDWGSIQSWETITEPGATQRIKSFTSISGPCLDHVGSWMQTAMRSGSLSDIGGTLNQIAHSWYILLFQFPLLAPLLWQAGLGNAWPTLLKHLEGISDAPASPTQTDDGKTGIALYRKNMLPRLLKPRARYAQVPVQQIFATQDKFVSARMIDVANAWVEHLWKRPVATTHWLQLSHPQALARWIDQFVMHIETGKPDAELDRYKASTSTQSALKRQVQNQPQKPAQTSKKTRPFLGKLAVITGAGSGIGRETALALAEQGMDVVCTDINEHDAQRTATLARLLGSNAYVYRVDVADASAMETFASQLRAHHGVPDVVINNAGIGMAGGFMKTSVKDWQKVLDVNLWGVIHGSRLFAQQMIEDAKPGHIVNVASAAAYTPSAAYPAYATTKAAVFMLTDCLRAELSKHHIGVSTICPGIINTNITRNTRFVGDDQYTEQKKQQKTTQLYKKRAFTPDRVAREIVDAIKHNRPIVTVSPEAKGLRLLSRFAPGVLRTLARFDVTPA